MAEKANRRFSFTGQLERILNKAQEQNEARKAAENIQDITAKILDAIEREVESGKYYGQSFMLRNVTRSPTPMFFESLQIELDLIPGVDRIVYVPTDCHYLVISLSDCAHRLACKDYLHIDMNFCA